jgi:hypothetical protein
MGDVVPTMIHDFVVTNWEMLLLSLVHDSNHLPMVTIIHD